MGEAERSEQEESLARLEKAYRSERPRLMARLRRAERTLEEAEDLIHDVYAETMQRLPLVGTIANLPAWINSLFKRRMVDLWRHEQVRSRSGETDVAEDTLREIISGAGLNPLDDYVRESLVEATGESIDTLTARKRYAMNKLSRALRHWIDD